MQNTGENEQDLRKIVDLTRLFSIFILVLHFYYYCYVAFEKWQIRSSITDKVLVNIAHTGLFASPFISKLLALGLLVISMLGVHGTKNKNLSRKTIVILLLIGMFLFFCSGPFLKLHLSSEGDSYHLHDLLQETASCSCLQGSIILPD